jgi:hypothetical protein
MSLKAKADKLLAEARELVPAAEDLERRAEYEAWIAQHYAALEQICEGTPEPLQQAVVERMQKAVRHWIEDEAADLQDDGLLLWAEKSLHQDAVPIPDELPAELMQAWLDDPQALPCHECGDCGLLVPTDRQRKVEYFPTCPMCGGRTGLLAWFYAIHDAVKLLPYEKAFPAICGKVSPLTVLVEAGYQVGTRLSEWIKRLPRREP